MLRTRLIFATAILAILAAGCGEKGSTTGDATTGSTGQGSANKQLKLVYIPKNTGNAYFDPEIEGYREACLANNVEFTTLGPEKAEPTSQVPIIEEQIQRGVDIIAVTPNAPDTLNTVLDDAKKQGILVVCSDGDLTGNESHRDAAVLPVDFSKVGAAQVELLGSMINYEGSIAILSATKEAPNQSVWVAGMQEALKQPKYAKMKLVEIAYGDDNSEKSTTEFQALQTKYPDLVGVIAPTSVGIKAAGLSLARSGKYAGGPKANGKGITLTGLGLPSELVKLVEDGVIQKFQLWDVKSMGLVAAHMAIGMRKGSIKPGEGGTFDVPSLGSRTFGPNNIVAAGDLITYDKSNIGQAK